MTWVGDECVICGTSPEDFKRGMAVGELTLGDVNLVLDEEDNGPICSRSCMFKLDFDVYPFDGYAIADRFKYIKG